jgi:hypothetical protein
MGYVAKGILLLLIILPVKSHAYEWKEVVAVDILIIADWLQTREFVRNRPDLEEKNPILGTHPSISKVDKYILAGFLTYNIAAVILPDKYSNILTRGLGAIELGAVFRNHTKGVQISINF